MARSSCPQPAHHALRDDDPTIADGDRCRLDRHAGGRAARLGARLETGDCGTQIRQRRLGVVPQYVVPERTDGPHQCVVIDPRLPGDEDAAMAGPRQLEPMIWHLLAEVLARSQTDEP